MDLKAVELQIAVPRTQEVGRIQQEAQQRPQIDQSLLSTANMKERELDRHRSSNVDESAHNRTIKREDSSSSGNQRQGQASPEEKQAAQEKEQQPADHPYKGKHIDLSL
ncbi:MULTISPECIES: hypothetical protein [Paenibacillus]|uniref:Uncharacterized protein n=1 Tax=Paenibacillus vini TaxID=1476024 RepID=A0ABQ4M8E4_9BACL|nr:MULTISPECIES: hypothetical protein [Paenibacillus]MBQ4898966.1 hypothetical protein [Paenibacillus sp. Marseille-P2973]MDN4066867.1 hypothetical protein [Paenibacillus vini]GIP52263.1 hypothetical protein J42TS3_12980 [Paenibacillus vini]